MVRENLWDSSARAVRPYCFRHNLHPSDIPRAAPISLFGAALNVLCIRLVMR